MAQCYRNLGDVCLALKQADNAREYHEKAKHIYQLTEGNKYDAFFDNKIKALGQSSHSTADQSESSRMGRQRKLTERKDKCVVS